MDYLRQIENDLIEKEQIKQREFLLRQQYNELQLMSQQDRKEIEKFTNSINQDRLKIENLEQECSQLLETMQMKEQKNTQLELELDAYKSLTQRLYYHFQLPL
ncbi:hypothetical protein DMUE_6375, partial [Dictyocoela muelleri]